MFDLMLLYSLLEVQKPDLSYLCLMGMIDIYKNQNL